MGSFIRINDHFVPFHAVSGIEDDGEEVLITLRDGTQGSGTIRVNGDAAAQLRRWLEERTAIALETESVLRDNGARMDD